MTHQIQQAIQKAISGAESVLWVGQPNRTKMVLKKLPVFFMSFFWNAFVLFWIWGASGFQTKISAFGWFGVPFLLVGIYLFLSPLLEFISAPKKAYAITETRILIFSNILKGKLTIDYIKNVQSLKLKNSKNTFGDLYIEMNPQQENTSELLQKSFSRMDPEKVNQMDLAQMEKRLIALRSRPYTICFLGVQRVSQAEQILSDKINLLK